MILKNKENMNVFFKDGKRVLSKDGIEIEYDVYKYEYYEKYVKKSYKNDFHPKDKSISKDNKTIKQKSGSRKLYDGELELIKARINFINYFYIELISIKKYDDELKERIFDISSEFYFSKFDLSTLNSLKEKIGKTYNIEYLQDKFEDDNIKIISYIAKINTMFLFNRMKCFSDCIKYITKLAVKDITPTDSEVRAFSKLLFTARYEYMTNIKFNIVDRNGERMSSVEFHIRNSLKQHESERRNKFKQEFNEKYLKHDYKELNNLIENVIQEYKIDDLQKEIIKYIRDNKNSNVTFVNIKIKVNKHYSKNIINNSYFNFASQDFEELSKAYILKFVHGWVKGRYRKFKKLEDDGKDIKNNNDEFVFIFKKMKEKVKYRFISNIEYNYRLSNRNNIYKNDKYIDSVDKEIIKCEETYRVKSTQSFIDFHLELNGYEEKYGDKTTPDEAFGKYKFSDFIKQLNMTDNSNVFEPKIYTNYEKGFSKELLYGPFRYRQYLVHFQNMGSKNIYNNNKKKNSSLTDYNNAQENNNNELSNILNKSICNSFKNMVESMELYHLNNYGFDIFCKNIVDSKRDMIDKNYTKHTVLPRFSKVGVNLPEGRDDETIIKNRIYKNLCNLIYETSYAATFSCDEEKSYERLKRQVDNDDKDKFKNVVRKSKNLDQYQQGILSLSKSKPELLNKYNSNFNKLVRQDFSKFLEKHSIDITKLFEEITIYDKTNGQAETNELNEEQNKIKKERIEDYKKRINIDNIDFNRNLEDISDFPYVYDMMLTTILCNNHSVSTQIQNISKYVQYLQSLKLKYGDKVFLESFKNILSKNISTTNIDYDKYIEVLKQTQNILNVILKDNSFTEDYIIVDKKCQQNLKKYQNDNKSARDFEKANEFFFPINNMDGDDIYFNKNRIIKNLSNGNYLDYILNRHKSFMINEKLSAQDFVDCYEFFKGNDFNKFENISIIKNEIKYGNFNTNDLKSTFGSEYNDELTVLENLYSTKDEIYIEIKKKRKIVENSNKNNREKNETEFEKCTTKLENIYIFLNVYDFVRKYKNYILLAEAEKMINFQRETIVSSFRTLEKDAYFLTNKEQKFNEVVSSVNDIFNKLTNEIKKIDYKDIQDARNSIVHNNYLRKNKDMSLSEIGNVFKDKLFKYNIRDYKNYQNYMEHTLNRHKIYECKNKFIPRRHPKYDFLLVSNIEATYYSYYYYDNVDYVDKVSVKEQYNQEFGDTIRRLFQLN